MAIRPLLWFAVVLLATPVLAYSHDSTQADAGWQDRERSWQVTSDPNNLEAVGTAEEDVLRLTFRGEREEFRLDWRAADAPNMSLRVRLDALVEFQDRDGDLRYSLGDPVVERRDLSQVASLRTIRVEEGEHGPEAIVTYRLRGTFNGEMVVRLFFTETAFQGDNTTQPPSWIEMETSIRNYPFKSDNMTRLALETRVSQGTILSDHAVGVAGADIDLFFAWNETADSSTGRQVAGTTIQPYAAEPAETLIVFSYGRNASLTHEMTLGATRIVPVPIVESLLGDWRVFAVGILISLAVVGLTIRYVVMKES